MVIQSKLKQLFTRTKRGVIANYYCISITASYYWLLIVNPLIKETTDAIKDLERGQVSV